ncbi:unnamed protein product, partial [Discosporangium mesarthrocarpum]
MEDEATYVGIFLQRKLQGLKDGSSARSSTPPPHHEDKLMPPTMASSATHTPSWGLEEPLLEGTEEDRIKPLKTNFTSEQIDLLHSREHDQPHRVKDLLQTTPQTTPRASSVDSLDDESSGFRGAGAVPASGRGKWVGEDTYELQYDIFPRVGLSDHVGNTAGFPRSTKESSALFWEEAESMDARLSDLAAPSDAGAGRKSARRHSRGALRRTAHGVGMEQQQARSRSLGAEDTERSARGQSMPAKPRGATGLDRPHTGGG